VPRFDPVGLEAGTAGAITLTLRNEGEMPVRTVDAWASMSLEGKRIFEGNAPYLDTGKEMAITATIHAPDQPGPLDFHLTYLCLRLDGAHDTGNSRVTLDVTPRRDQAPLADLGPSPYIVGSPVEQREMLYGREPILRNIRRQLATDHQANVVLLEGARRTGKTSILKRLLLDGVPGWIPVEVNLQDAEGEQGRAGLTSKEIFRFFAHQLALALVKAGTPVWLPDAPPPGPGRYELQLRRALNAYFADDHPFEAFEIYVKTVIEAVAPKRVLFMLDEFDKIQEGIDAQITSPQVPENIRHLLQTYSQVGGILSGSRRITRLRNEYWSALFGIGYAVRVGPLEVEAACDLVTGPAAGKLVYAPDARDRIVDLCACQPFLIQTMCNRIFEAADERGERTVTPEAVDRAARAMTGDYEHFETLWGYARTARRRLILALLCELTRSAQLRALDARVLEDELLRNGVAPPPEGIGEDMASLREMELCELETFNEYQRYRVAVPLLAEWVRRNKDFSDLVRRARAEQDVGGE
jgi:type I restriction enzyme M protein